MRICRYEVLKIGFSFAASAVTAARLEEKFVIEPFFFGGIVVIFSGMMMMMILSLKCYIF